MGLDDFAALVPPALLGRSGSVFYSGRSAFVGRAKLYLLGLNPGGSPVAQADETIGLDLADWSALPERWSAYADESWMGMPPGTCGLQPRVLHLFNQLQIDPPDVPASNVVFVRSSTEAALAEEKRSLLAACWPVHERVITTLGVRVIVCLGTTAGAWVREAVGASSLVDELREQNNRGWRSQTHQNKEGLQVVTLTHPSRADWTNPASDPTPLVRRAFEREGPTTKGSTMTQVVTSAGSAPRAELMNPPKISAPTVRSAHVHLLQVTATMNLRTEPHTSAISAIKLYDRRDRYLFSWIINPHHLLFYIRKPALKLAPHLAHVARERLRAVNINPAGEVTVRIDSLAAAQALTEWLFNPSTWTGGMPGEQVGNVSTQELPDGARGPTPHRLIR